METISFVTSDQVTIVGDYYKSEHPIGQTILALHMMPADRKSWHDFAEAANLAGYDVLAIDLRGHGESLQQDDKRLDFNKFTDQDHQGSIKDLEAAVDWLISQGVESGRLSLIGASIGANLSLWYMQKHPEIYNVVLVSPGLNYRGIQTDKLAANLQATQSVLLIAGDKDEYSHQSVVQLQSLIPGNCETIILPTTAHGTNLFNEHPKLIVRILGWLNEEVWL